jgi:hypothetical protein
MTDKSWKDMTPAERMQVAIEAMQNPCEVHDYEDSVNAMGEATMLHQICKVCFDVKGWIYNWDTRE